MFYADLHTHSPYAGGCSKAITFKGMVTWAKKKGISVLGTGDCFHPKWEHEIAGLSIDENIDMLYYESDRSVYFIPTVEVNCYHGRYQTHMLLVFPNMQAARDVRHVLTQYGNLTRKGRPDIKLSPGQLMDAVKSEFNDTIVIAAHILTPWYGLYGSRNDIQSYTDLMEVPPDAIESGLSASWRMAGAIKEMGDVPIVSFSDMHSVQNIGREVTQFCGDIFSQQIIQSLRSKQLKTIEFPPALGRYHYSGHSDCKHSVGPGGDLVCPKCFKVVTKGAEERLRELETAWPICEETFVIPLAFLLALVLDSDPRADDVYDIYHEMTQVANEIELLTKFPIERIKDKNVRHIIALARAQQLKIIPGYDGKLGEVVNLNPLLVKNMEQANELFMDDKEHKAFWDHAEVVSKLMTNGDMTMPRDEYETLCRGPL